MCDPIFDIRHKSIVVAGAASGLGRAMALALKARGACLTLADVSAAGLAKAADELGSDVAVCAADITREEEVEAAFSFAIERFGAVDGVVNTVGRLHISPALQLQADTFRATLDANVTGAFLLSRAAARTMAGKGGRIVHFASVSSLVANRDYAAYASSKAALSQLVRVLAREWAPHGITVNAIGPAMTETPMTENYLARSDFRAQSLASIPLCRLGRPEDLIGTLVLLLAPGGAFITGQTVYVDGGRTLT